MRQTTIGLSESKNNNLFRSNKSFRATAFAALLMAAGAWTSSATAQTTFSDVSLTAGVELTTESYGASWADFNNDGLLDLFVSNHREQPGLYLNRGDGTFYNTAGQVLTWVNRATADTHGASFGDFDNDGDQDLLVSLGTGNPNQLFVNDNGAMIDKTDELGVAFETIGGRLPVWLDYNGDGLLDFVMTQFGGAGKVFTQTGTGFVDDTTTVGMLCLRFQYGQLFDVNDDARLDFLCPDDASFPQKIYDTFPTPWTDLTSSFPAVTQVADTFIADFDNDQRLDMFLIGNVQLRPSSVLQADTNIIEAHLTGGEKGFNFQTTGNVTVDLDWNKLEDGFGLPLIRIGANEINPFQVPFTLDPADPNVAGMPPSDPAAAPIMRIGYDPATQTWTFISQTENIFSEAYYVVTTDQPATNVNSTGLLGSDQGGEPTLIMNNVGGFADETMLAGLDSEIECGTVTAGDFDNDMDVDLYLACRTGAENLENIYYDNQGDGTFLPVTAAGGAGGPVGSNFTSGAGTADSAIAGDYDADGFLDLFVTNGFGLRPKNFGGQNKLYRNLGNSNHWIQIDLVGTSGTRDPVGARVLATANLVTQLRVFDGGYHRWSQEPSRLHFGLGTATTVDLTVEWPNGTSETFLAVAADQIIEITEGTGITTVTPGSGQPYACGAPSYDPSTEAGVYVWRDCLNDRWQFRFASGGPFERYIGQVVADAAYTSVTPFSIEAADVLDSTTDPLQISYNLGMVGSGQDGFDVVLAPDSNACFELDDPLSATVFYGPFKLPMAFPFDLVTGGACNLNLIELSVDDVQADETAGQLVFTLSLSAAAAGTVTVDAVTADGTATAGSDYTATGPTTITFLAGETSKQVTVPLLDDLLGESDETFSLILSNPSGATIADSTGVGTIIDDEVSACGEPTFSAGFEAGVFIWQDCNTGDWFARYTAGGPTTVIYDGSIVSNAAFSQVTGFSLEGNDVLDSTTDPLQIDFNLRMINAGVDGIDFRPAQGATACFELNAPAGAMVYAGADRNVVTPPFDLFTLGACSGLLPTVSVTSDSVSETGAQVDLDVTLSASSASVVQVDVVTVDGTATDGQDYTGQAVSTITFNPGETTKPYSIPILDDALAEGDETFTVALSNVSGATLGQNGTVTITDDETSPCGEPSFSAGTEAGVFVWRDCGTDDWHMRVAGGGSFTIYDGQIVSSSAYSQVTGFSIDPTDTLDFTTDPLQIAYELRVSGSGVDGIDFTPASGANTCFELNAPGAATIFLGAGKVPTTAPFDLDTLGACGGLLPDVSIDDASIAETAGSVIATVTLTAASLDPVTVTVNSVDDTATAGEDYIAVQSTAVVIDAGQTSKTFSVPILDDALAEGDETFSLVLSNPVNATLGDDTGEITIVDDELSPCGQPTYNTSTEAGVFVWKDCATSQWFLRASAGGVFTTNDGTLASTANFQQVAGFSIEGSDTLDFTTDPSTITFGLQVSGAGQDGIDFTPDPASTTCLTLTAPPGQTIYVGAARTVVASPFELGTLAACGQLPELNVTSETVTEADTAVFTITLSAISGVPVSFDYTTADVTAVAPGDYTAVSGNITIPAGSLSATVAVNTGDDSEIENAETFHLVLSNPTAATIGNGTGVGTITDDDAASLSIDSVSDIETGGPLTFTVTLSVANVVPVTVDYITSDQSATASFDYTAHPLTTLTFNPGETTKTIDVVLLDDSDVEGDETFAVTLSNPSGASISVAEGIGTITDSEPLPLITVADTATTEAPGATAVFAVAMSTASTQPVTVDYVTTDGSATAAADYVAAGPATLTFNPGEVAKNIVVSVLDDALIESAETFNLVLSNPTRAAFGDASAVATINDDEGNPTLTVADANASEIDGTLEFTAVLSAASTVSVSVDYATADGTATAGSDYTAQSGTLVFAPGTTSQNVSIPLLDDQDLEFSESFDLNLSNPSGVILGTTTALGTIGDDEAVVCGEPSYDPATEGVVAVWLDCDGSNMWHARMTSGSGFKSYPGAIRSNQGFVSVAGFNLEPSDTLETATDPSSIVFTLSMSAPGVDGIDFELSPTATVCFNVNIPPGSSVIVGADRTPGSGSFDLRTVGPCQTLPTITAADIQVTEGPGATATFDVNLSSSSTETVSIDYQTQGGTAVEGTDYTGVGPATLVFAPGETSKSVVVSIIDDAEIETSEEFTLELTQAVNASFGTGVISRTVTATLDDDEIEPAFSVSDINFDETAGSVTIDVILAAPAAQTVTVDVNSVDGLATAAADYTAVPLQTLTFLTGEVTKTVATTMLNDSLAEGPEDFFIQLSNNVGAPIVNGTATVTINDDEPSPCGIPSYDPGVDVGLFVWKNCQTGDWDARYVPGNSFKIFTGRMTSGAAFQSVTPFSIEGNDVLDYTTDPAVIEHVLRIGAGFEDGFTFDMAAGETACVEVDSPAGTTVYVGAARTALTPPFSLDTLGTCGALPTVSIDGPAGVTEGPGAVVTFTASLSAPAAADVTVDVASADGTATAGSDYTALPTTQLTILAGQLTATQDVTLLDDAVSEGDETFTVTLSNVSANASLGTAVGTGTINDDESVPTVSIDSPAGVTEGPAAVITFTATLSAPAAADVTVDVASADGTATAGSDYTALPTTQLTILAGQLTATQDVTLLDDAVSEGDETFTVTLSNVSANASLGTAVGTGTINDDESVPTVSIDSPAGVTEGPAAVITFTATLSAPAAADVTVDVASADGTATAGSDYTALPTTQLTILAGQLTATQDVTLLDDAVSEGDETFTVTLSNVSANASLGTAVGTGTINDDESVPTVSIDSPAGVTEGPAAVITFTATLSAPAAADVTVDVASADGTATAGSDYTALPTTQLTILAGQLTATQDVTLLDDAVSEGDETFTVTLSNVSANASLGTAVGTGTINDDD